MINRGGQRVEYLDAAKFIGLVLVCFCHIPLPEGNFHVWVYSFHMPLFFLVSGVFFSVDRFAVGASARQLLVPFVFFNLLACAISVGIGLAVSGEAAGFKSLGADFLLKSYYVIGPSWFLVALFLIRLFCGLMLRYLGNAWLIGAAAALLAVFYFTREGALWQVLSLGSAVLGLPFYLIGMYARRVFLSEAHIGRWWVPLVALTLSVPAVYNGQVGIHINSFGANLALFILFGLSGTVLLVSLSRFVRIPQALLAVFMDGALFFICMHTLIFEYSILVWNKLTGDFSGNTLLEKVAFTALTFIISYPIILLMLKKAPFLLGKSNSRKAQVEGQNDIGKR